MPESGEIPYHSKVIQIKAEFLEGMAERYRKGNWASREMMENDRAESLSTAKRALLKSGRALLAAYKIRPAIPKTAKHPPWHPPAGWKPVTCPKLSSLIAELGVVDPDQAARVTTVPDANIPSLSDITQPITDLKWIALAGAVAFFLWGSK